MQQVRDCKQQSALDSNLGIKDFDARVVTEYETAIESQLSNHGLKGLSDH